MLLSSYLDSWWRHKLSGSKAMADREKKEGKMEIQKFEYLEN